MSKRPPPVPHQRASAPLHSPNGAAANQAEGYGVRIVPAAVATGQEYWHVVSVRHLSAEENRGKHSIFVDALDAAGQRERNPALRIGWTWEGRRGDEVADPKPLDKPANEPAGNVDINRGQIIQIWLEGDGRPSERVENLHTDHPDETASEGPGNPRFHHSFHVIFQRTQQGEPVIITGGNGDQPTGKFPPPAEQLLALPPGQNAIADTWNDYGGLILQQAQELGIDPAVAMAVVITESPGGLPFGPDGRMIVRFEPHIFWDRWGERHPEQFQQHFQLNEEQRWNGNFHRWRRSADGDWQPFHGNQALEWQVLALARTLDDTAALLSTSMGAPQIMGFNHLYLQYGTPQEMFTAFSEDALAQYRGLFDFIRAREVVDNLQNGDYLGFARVYNGPAWAQGYADLIAANLAAFRQLQSRAAARAAQSAAEAPIPAQLPMPVIDQSLATVDPELYVAWREHIIRGFQNNETMFRRVLNSFMYPYWITVAMYAALFTVGIAAFVVAVILAFRGGESTASIFGSTAIFGGLTALAFLSYFLSRPLQALEENLQFITWLGIIYNSYWTRLAYALKLETIQADVENITNDTIAKLNALLDKHAERSGKRPNAQ